MFSRPVNSGWKPAPSSISADTRPRTETCPVVGLRMPAEHLEQRGLAGAVRADDPDHPAAAEVEAHVAERPELLAREEPGPAAPDEEADEEVLDGGDLTPPVEPEALARRPAGRPRSPRDAERPAHARQTSSARLSRRRSNTHQPPTSATAAQTVTVPRWIQCGSPAEEEDVLVALDQPRDRVQEVERPERHGQGLAQAERRRDRRHRVEDRRQEEEERQPVRQDLLHVPEVDVERGQRQREAGGEQELEDEEERAGTASTACGRIAEDQEEARRGGAATGAC